MKDQFLEKAKTWDTTAWKENLAEDVYQKIVNELSIDPKCKLVDIGGGTGLLSLKFLNNLAHVTVVDTSEGMLSVLRKKIDAYQLTEVDIIEGELERGTFENETVGLCISMMTLHHIKDLTSLFELIYDMLTPGGSVAFVDLAKEDGNFHPAGSVYVHNGFTSEELLAPLKKAGFIDCSVESAFSIPRTMENGETKTYPLLLVCASK